MRHTNEYIVDKLKIGVEIAHTMVKKHGKDFETVTMEREGRVSPARHEDMLLLVMDQFVCADISPEHLLQ